jgi:hypothetical protein
VERDRLGRGGHAQGFRPAASASGRRHALSTPPPGQWRFSRQSGRTSTAPRPEDVVGSAAEELADRDLVVPPDLTPTCTYSDKRDG